MVANLGETRIITASFMKNGVPFEPTTLTLHLTTPSGAISVVGPGAPIVSDGAGAYHYNYVTTEIGSTVATWNAVDGSGNVILISQVIEVSAVSAMPRVMTSDELELCIGAATVDQLFDDSGDSIRDTVLVAQMLRRAEDYALTYMLAGWADTQTCVKVMQGDSILRMHIAWVACEYAAERRKEFLASDGKGPYINQYTRAETYFDKISIAALASVSEQTVGLNAQSGGVVQPALAPGCPRFVFAPDKNSPFGHGGF